jgi:hypothetical protein
MYLIRVTLISFLQAEREAKYALKKELDQRINSESMFNLSNLAFSIRGKWLYHLLVWARAIQTS